MRAERLFLRARAVINFLVRAASTLEITNGEQRALRKFSASWNFALVGAKLSNTIRPYRGSTIPSSLQPIMIYLVCCLLQNYFT